MSELENQSKLRKTTELEKPTIAGLVEKLVNGNYIDENEAETVQALLEQSSAEMTEKEKAKLVTTLNARLEATNSDLVTPNGLNYAVFENEVKKVTQLIEIDKVQREKKQAQATVEPLQEKKDVEKTPQEKAEIERQERIAYNKGFVKNIFKHIHGLEDIEIPEEIQAEISNDIDLLELYYAENDEQSKNDDNAEGNDVTQNEIKGKKCPINPENLEYIQRLLFIKKMQQDMESNPNHSIGDAINNVRNQNKQLSKDVEETGFIDEILQAGTIFVGSIKNATINYLTRKLENGILDAHASINRSETENVIAISELKVQIDKRENYRRVLKKIYEIKERNEPPKEELNNFFEQLTKTYLSSNTSLSILYDELSEDENVKKFDLDFDDFVEGIKTNLFRDAKGDPIHENELADMLRAEREIRKYDIFNESLRISEEKGFMLNKSDKNDLEKQRNLEDAERRTTKYLKGRWAKRKGIDVIENAPPKERRTRIKRESKVSAKTIELQIKRISNDRKQIIETAKEFGISIDEAAKKYFAENPEVLKSYTKKERTILTRGKNSEDTSLQTNRILNKLNHFRKVKNNQLISLYTADIVVLSKKIEELKSGIDNPRELDAELQKLEKVKRKLEIAQKLKEKLEKKSKSKSAIDIIDEKVKKNVEKEIFLKYLKSGKSAVEIFADIEAGGNEYGFNKEDMIRIIEEGARKYLQQGSELNSLVENEKTLFDKENTLTALRIKKENAEKKGLDDWTVPYKRQIAKLESEQKVDKEINEKYKNKILIRMGLAPNNIERTDNATQVPEETQSSNSGESRINSSADVAQTQEKQVRENKKGLEVED